MTAVFNRHFLVVIAAISALSMLSVPSASAGAATYGGSGKITIKGHIGSLRIGSSRRHAVRRFAGRPQRVYRLDYQGAPLALGYDCTHYGGCQTIFYLDHRTHRLVDFETSSRHYNGPFGTRVGMKTHAAERRAHRRARTGCVEAINFRGRRVFTSIEIVSHRQPHGRRVRGGHVYGFLLMSKHHVLPC